MQIKEYVGWILSSISANPYVESQSISCQERPPDGAYLSGLVAFIDGSQLHIKEFILFDSTGARIVKYGYNYLDSLFFSPLKRRESKRREPFPYPRAVSVLLKDHHCRNRLLQKLVEILLPLVHGETISRAPAVLPNRG